MPIYNAVITAVTQSNHKHFATYLILTEAVTLVTRARLRGQHFATGKNFSFNQSHTKSFAFFSRESYFIKAIENSFPVFA